MIECLKEIAVAKAFQGESTEGIQEAKETIELMFDKLALAYGKIEANKQSNSR